VPVVVHLHAQLRKQFRHTLDFVDDDEFVSERGKKHFTFAEFCEVSGTFEVKECGISLGRDLPSKRRLSDLSRCKQGGDRELVKGLDEASGDSLGDHCCIVKSRVS
jgi:hypothetical protein